MDKLVFSGILAFTILLSLSLGSASAHPHTGQVLINGHTHTPQTQTSPLTQTTNLEQSTLLFHSPKDSTIPWAYVEGKIADPVDGYPVIIQIFRGEEAVHFAQADVSPDGTYQYKFRVLNSDDGITTRIFDGDYLVKIFKVVYKSQENLV